MSNNKEIEIGNTHKLSGTATLVVRSFTTINGKVIAHGLRLSDGPFGSARNASIPVSELGEKA
jgi:hypothetical protein